MPSIHGCASAHMMPTSTPAHTDAGSWCRGPARWGATCSHRSDHLAGTVTRPASTPACNHATLVYAHTIPLPCCARTHARSLACTHAHMHASKCVCRLCVRWHNSEGTAPDTDSNEPQSTKQSTPLSQKRNELADMTQELRLDEKKGSPTAKLCGSRGG